MDEQLIVQRKLRDLSHSSKEEYYDMLVPGICKGYYNNREGKSN